MKLRDYFRRDAQTSPVETDLNAATIEQLYRIAGSIDDEFNFQPISIIEALRSPLVVAAQSVIARASWGTEFAAESRTGKPLPESPGLDLFNQLMDDPNPTMGADNLIARVTASLLLMGKLYLVRGSESGYTDSLWPVSREDMTITRDSSGNALTYHVIQTGNNYGYRQQFLRATGGKDTLSADQVIEFTLLHSELGANREHYDTSDGIHPLKALTGDLTSDSKTTSRVSALLSLGAGIAISPAGQTGGPARAGGQPMNPADAKTALEVTQQRIKELTRMSADGEPVVFPTGIKVDHLGFPPDKMLPANLTKRPESRTASLFGIPLGLIGFELGVDGGQSYASLEVQERFFATYTQAPIARYIARVISREVLAEFVPNASYRLREESIPALQEDMNQSHDRIRADWNDGLITRNQALIQMGMEPVGPPGDVLKISTSHEYVPESELDQVSNLIGAGDAEPEAESELAPEVDDDAQAALDELERRAGENAALNGNGRRRYPAGSPN